MTDAEFDGVLREHALDNREHAAESRVIARRAVLLERLIEDLDDLAKDGW